MTSELRTSKHEYFQPSNTFWNDEDAPDIDDKQAEEFDAMQESEYEPYDCMQDAPDAVTHLQPERLPDDIMQEDAPCPGPEMSDHQMADPDTQRTLPNLDAPSGGGVSNLDDNLPSKGHSHKHSDSAKRARVGMSGMPETTKPLPVPLEKVQTLLQSAGDGVSILGDTHYIASKGMWRIPTNQSSQSRKCLIKSGITHDGASVAILFIKRDNNDFCVKYQCTSRQCVTCPKPTLGQIIMDMDTFQWQIQLSQTDVSLVPLQQAEAAAAPLLQQAAAYHQAAAVESYVNSLKSYNPRVCEILSRLAAIEQSAYGFNSKLWLQHSARFGYLDADTQMAIWNRHLGDTHLSLESAVDELNNLSRADNPSPDNKALNNYDYVKRVIMSEYGLCKFRKNVTYAQRDRSLVDNSMLKTLNYLSKDNLFTLLAEQFYFELVVSEDGTVNYKRKRFIDKWIEDLDKPFYQGVDIDPGGKSLSSAVYNMWTGFDVQKIPRNISAIVGERSSRILGHIRSVFACDNPKINDFILDLLAHYHFKPWVRTNVLMFIYGLQGAGKSWFTDLICALMGSTTYAETHKPDRSLFGKHGYLWLGRIVVHIEEAKNLREFHSDLKNLTTASVLDYEEKFQPTKQARNYANFIITANTMNAVFVPFDDRRIFALKVSSEKIGDAKYFDAIFDDIKDSTVLRDFYDYLGTRDISRFKDAGMQSEIPKTDFWMSCVRMGASPIHSFLSAFVVKHLEGSSAIIQILASSFRRDLHSYQQMRGGKITPDNQVPMRINELGPDNGFTYKTSGGVAKYTFDLAKMKNFLIKKHLFDEEATF
jgi:hypothetical protein